MKIQPNGSKASAKGPENYFTGTVRIDAPFKTEEPGRVEGAYVNRAALTGILFVTITREYGGLGLGLAIAKGTVEAHGGELHASSPGRGQGATFTVSLPLVAAG